LALEDVVAQLADEAIANVYASARERTPRAGSAPRTRRRHRELAEEAKLLLSERIEAPPTLGDLAGLLGCSPFHLSRTFHGTVGVSLRRYVHRLRARLAADRLAAGARDLTNLALDLGYFDHSHFTKSFRREWGVPPSRFRAARSRAMPTGDMTERRPARRRS
jgi:AraC-like DNA-binding protein